MRAVLFCLVRFGFKPRIATEQSNAAKPRIEKIYELIQGSKYSIHDLSRSQASQANELSRLNMPFELGVDFGCQRYGGNPFSEKVILILEEKPFLYQKTISDLAGSDIAAHKGDFETAVRKVRNWLTLNIPDVDRVGASKVLSEYGDFQEWHIERQLEKGFMEQDIQDYLTSELLDEMLIWFDDCLLGKPTFDGKASDVPPPRMTSSFGEAKFDYSNCDGNYIIGSGAAEFETKWSKASNTSIHIYNTPISIHGVAIDQNTSAIHEITKASSLDYTSRVQTPKIGQVVVLRNRNGLYAAVQILKIKDNTRGDNSDELHFRYAIQGDGTDSFECFRESLEMIEPSMSMSDNSV